MVMDYTDIYASIQDQIPRQNWYSDEWIHRQDEDNIWLHNERWEAEGEPMIWFHSFGQGEDPEQQPLILDFDVGRQFPDREEFLADLDEEIAPRMRPLIGWEPGPEDDPDIWQRKELPSDPITVVPRVLEEFTKLQPIARSVTEMFSGWMEDREVTAGEPATGTPG